MRVITFFNVGQALFCKEQIAGFTIVYDCGGENATIIKDVINKTAFVKDETIDILFLSHYDRDHINGVFTLLNHCKVLHLVLPMVPLLSMVKASFSVPSRIKNYQLFYENPKGFIVKYSEITKVHFVKMRELDSDIKFEPIYGIENLPDEIESNREIYLSDTWFLKTFNRKYLSKKEEICFLKELGLKDGSSFTDIKVAWEKRNLKIKAAATSLKIVTKANINDYSMTLFSGNTIKCNGCLYLGDYNAKKYFSDLKNAYLNEWNYIQYVQIPHHGSKQNFHNSLIIPHGVHIISNKYKPQKKGDVDATFVVNEIEITANEKCNKTWNGDLVY